MNWLRIALRNVLRDATRVISTLLIIAVGLTALLVGSGFMLSTYDALQEIAMRSEGHVIIIDDNPAPALGGTHQQLSLSHWQTLQSALSEDDRIVRVLPRARFEGMISKGNQSAVFFGSGVDPKEEFRVHGPFLRTDGVLNPWLTLQETPDVVLGAQLARTLNATKGDLLTLHTQNRHGKNSAITVQLAGLYHTGTPEIDNHSLMTNLTTVATLLDTDNISQLSIYLHQREASAAVQTLLQNSRDGITVQTWQQRAELHHKVKALYDRIFGVMGFIILVVIFLAISNTIALAIHQRREEIATLSALGTNPSRIYANFILEACLIGLAATTLGMLLAYAISNGINLAELMMPAPPGKTEGYPIFIYISWPHYLITSAMLIILAALASFLATYKATRVNIAHALS